MSRTAVFVYGSLKRGFVHHDQLEGASFAGEAITAKGYALHRVGQYPALARAPSGTVRGELYFVTREHLERLDRFEGCPELYQRDLVELSDGSKVEGYVMAAEAVAGSPVVEGGSWPLGSVLVRD